MQIRRAQAEDARGIAKVHVDSWRTTYRGIVPSSFLDKLSYDQRTALWERNIADRESYIVVAEDEESGIVGFGTAAKRSSNQVERSSNLTSIYLLDKFQGQGIGKALLKELFVHFKLQGCERVFVDVLEDNKTRHFYEYYGAKRIDAVKIQIGGSILSEWIYEWDNVDEVLKRL